MFCCSQTVAAQVPIPAATKPAAEPKSKKRPRSTQQADDANHPPTSTRRGKNATAVGAEAGSAPATANSAGTSKSGTASANRNNESGSGKRTERDGSDSDDADAEDDADGFESDRVNMRELDDGGLDDGFGSDGEYCKHLRVLHAALFEVKSAAHSFGSVSVLSACAEDYPADD